MFFPTNVHTISPNLHLFLTEVHFATSMPSSAHVVHTNIRVQPRRKDEKAALPGQFGVRVVQLDVILIIIVR